MADVAQQTQQEFWRPPAPVVASEVILHEAMPTMAEACPRCGSEFLLGSRFCHTCGGRRPEAMSLAAQADAAAMANHWQQVVGRTRMAAIWVAEGCGRALKRSAEILDRISFPAWLQNLHFHEIQRRAGLSIASFIAFLIGVGCVGGALLVGLLTAKTYVDWQAIQFYRAEWLLAATAAFVAGILLKKPSRRDRE
jgi:uncharacterized membrane protein YphA (DoxX/SURF4 family)